MLLSDSITVIHIWLLERAEGEVTLEDSTYYYFQSHPTTAAAATASIQQREKWSVTGFSNFKFGC